MHFILLSLSTCELPTYTLLLLSYSIGDCFGCFVGCTCGHQHQQKQRLQLNDFSLLWLLPLLLPLQLNCSCKHKQPLTASPNLLVHSSLWMLSMALALVVWSLIFLSNQLMHKHKTHTNKLILNLSSRRLTTYNLLFAIYLLHHTNTHTTNRTELLCTSSTAFAGRHFGPWFLWLNWPSVTLTGVHRSSTSTSSGWRWWRSIPSIATWSANHGKCQVSNDTSPDRRASYKHSGQ